MADRFTTRTLDALKTPTSGQVERFDSVCRGLSIRIGTSGRKTWSFFYRDMGKRSRTTLGTYPSLSLADARVKADSIRRGLQAGVTPRQQDAEKKRAGTVATLFDDFERRYTKPRKRTWKRDRQMFELDIRSAIGDMAPRDVRRSDIVAMIDRIADRGSPIAANRTLALASKFFNWAVGRDIIEYNSASRVSKPGVEQQRSRVLSEDEIRAFWRASTMEPAHNSVLFRLQLITLQRSGEALSMRWEDISDNWWTIPGERSKNGLPHRVWLPDAALTLINQMKFPAKSSQWVFPSRTDPSQSRSAANKAIIRIRKAGGLQDFRTHDLRRTGASFMASMGISRLVISKVLNHAEQGVTAVYDRHTYDREKRQALDAWSTQLEAIVAGQRNSAKNVVQMRSGQ
jgi:integrase